jgi:hypothetical protein
MQSVPQDSISGPLINFESIRSTTQAKSSPSKKKTFRSGFQSYIFVRYYAENLFAWWFGVLLMRLQLRLSTQALVATLQTALDQIAHWSDANFMEINIKKSKQMFLFFGIASSRNQQSPLVLLLGVNISSDLRWDEHVDMICAKASKRLHYLSLLGRSSVRHADLLLYYKTIVRPIIEYACPVWQSGLTEEHRQRLEAIQRRALRIISGSTDYEFQCVIYDMESVSVRLQNLTKSFFDRINVKHDCLHWLLPPSRSNYTDRLRSSNTRRVRSRLSCD